MNDKYYLVESILLEYRIQDELKKLWEKIPSPYRGQVKSQLNVIKHRREALETLKFKKELNASSGGIWNTDKLKTQITKMKAALNKSKKELMKLSVKQNSVRAGITATVLISLIAIYVSMGKKLGREKQTKEQ